eukprot:scaffold19359_cov30-Prasinocladus_malaysianus.AAC.2
MYRYAMLLLVPVRVATTDTVFVRSVSWLSRDVVSRSCQAKGLEALSHDGWRLRDRAVSVKAYHVLCLFCGDQASLVRVMTTKRQPHIAVIKLISSDTPA